MTLKEKYRFAQEWFAEAIPVPVTELKYSNPFELLVAVVLSAQCTDKRVNIVTLALFDRFPDAHALAKGTSEEIYELIKSVSFGNSKTRYLMGLAQMLVEKHQGKVPEEHEQLTALPGVGRKTANVIVSVVFGTPAIAVDTHVFRVSQRIGLVRRSKTPLEVELQLIKNIAPELQGTFHHYLILHGRYTCTARSPKCEQCGLRPICHYYGLKRKPHIRIGGK